MRQERLRLTRNARLDIAAAVAWRRVLRRMWGSDDRLTVEALRAYVGLIR